MATLVTVRKWGNSVGIVFPKELAEKKHIKAEEKILIEVVKEGDLRKIFGSLERKSPGQEFKNMVRKGWK